MCERGYRGGKKLSIHPTNLTHSTPSDVLQGFAAEGLASGASSASGCLVMSTSYQCANNRVEQSHESTRVRERGMRRFKSMMQAQRFLGTHAAVKNLFNLGRHLVRAQHYRDLRVSAFSECSRAVARDLVVVSVGINDLICQNQQDLSERQFTHR